MYSLIITDKADFDLDEIIEYITIQLKNHKAAVDFITKIEDCYDRLQDNPFIYIACSDKRLSKLGYRKALIGNYVLIYRVDKEEKTVYKLVVKYL